MIAERGGKQIPALDSPTTVYTCSTGSVASGAAINGKIIDRRGLLSTNGGAYFSGLGQHDSAFTAEPFLFGWMAGSTYTGHTITVDVKLQHGDSSGGGDMADYSTGAQPAARVFGNSGLSTDYANWSTGLIMVTNNPCDYELTGAKRYVRAVGTVTKTGHSTSTAADDMNVLLGIDVRQFTYSAPPDGSTSSSTST